MVSDYKNANGDYRGVLERYLPTAYKTIGNGSDVHRGLLGALKQMLVTTEQDIIEGTQQVLLANANSWALDLYGDWVGESRKGELDDAYRARIIEKITLGRNTVGNIIAGIKREVNDPDLTVSVYEPWRNIFILNKSLLNGADRLMGNFYRYAVIQVTLNKYVNALELQVIADKYKSAGVSVVFVYREGIVAGDGTLLALPLRLINEGRNTVNRNRSQLYGNLLMNGLPTGAKATDLFTVNKSDINGTDVLASDPNSLYSNAYGTVPSKNIFGTTASNAGMTSDPFDFVYQQSKVDSSTVGGRNLLIGTKGYTFTNPGQWSNGGTVISDTYHGLKINQTSDAWGGPKYPISDLIRRGVVNTSDTYIMSSWFRNTSTAPVVIGFYASTSVTISPNYDVVATLPANSGWIRVVSPLIRFSSLDVTTGSLRFEPKTATTGGYIQQAGLKLEIGAVATPWTPAPEDTPKIYIHPYTGTDYTALNRLDGVTETVTASGLPTVAFNISEYVKGVLEAKALNDATLGGTVGRNLFQDSKGLSLVVGTNTGTVTVEPFDSTTNMWHIQAPATLGASAGFYTFAFGDEVKEGDSWSFSADIKGTGELRIMGMETGTHDPEPVGNLTADWTRMSQTGVRGSGPALVIYFNITDTLGVDAYVKLPKLERGTVATPWTPAPEDSPTSVDYTNFSTPVSSININLKGSPFGLSPTTINVLSQGGTPLTGKWYKNGNLISPQTPQVSDPVTPTGTWSFKLDTPTLVSSVTITDNYPDAKGSYRVITMNTTDNRELVLLNTTQQVTGTINTARLQTQTPEIYRPYIKSATIGDTTLTSPQVFDATTGHWIDITATTELVPYITYGDITNSLYVTLRNKTAQQNIDYLGLNVTRVSVEGQ